MPRHPKQHQADEELAINLDARDEAISDLRDAARRAGAAIEPLLRWAFQLQSDPPLAIRNMRKVLTTRDCENVALRFMAEKVLGTVSPDTINASTASRRVRAKSDAERELRREVEDELLKRCGLERYGDRTSEEQETRWRIRDHVCRLFEGPQRSAGRGRKAMASTRFP